MAERKKHHMMRELPSGPAASPAPWTTAATDESPDWLRYLLPLRTRWKIFVAVFSIVVALIVAITLRTPKSFTTTAKLLIGTTTDQSHSGADANTALPMLNALLAMSGQQSAETYSELLQEVPIAQQVIANLGLHTTPKALLGDISVKPVTNTSILAISATAKSAEESAAITNELARVFVDRERSIVGSEADSALADLTVELPKAEVTMRAAQQQVALQESQLHIPDLDSQKQSLLAQAVTIDSQLAQARLDEAEARAKLSDVHAQLASLPQSIANGASEAPNPVLAQLLTLQTQDEVQLQTLLRQYTPEYPSVISLKAQLGEVKRQIAGTPKMVVSGSSTGSNPVYQQLREQAAGYQTTIESSRAQIAELQAQRHAIAPTLARLPRQTYRIAQLKSRAKLAEDVYNEMKRKFAEATVAKTTTPSGVSIVDAARAEFAVKSPKLLFNVALACILGLIVASTIVYAGELFDRTIKDDVDVATLFGLPVLAGIPRLSEVAQAPAVAVGDAGPAQLRALGGRVAALFKAPVSSLVASGRVTAPEYAVPSARLLPDNGARNDSVRKQRVFVESFLQLVASLNYASDEPLRSISITSPLPGEGKSTIAFNVAVALAEVRPRVLLIDADMRRPTLHTRLNVSKRRGLSDVLIGTLQLKDAVRHSPLAGLDVMTSGASSPNPSKLLQSERFERLLDDARRSYSIVVVDGPAINVVFDGAVIASKTDGTVLVFSKGETEVKQIRRALYRLATAKANSIIGVVMNRTSVHVGGKSFAYYDVEEDQAALQDGYDA
jgi:succinoglycan biosynthesis transport protein ExoP